MERSVAGICSSAGSSTGSPVSGLKPDSTSGVAAAVGVSSAGVADSTSFAFAIEVDGETVAVEIVGRQVARLNAVRMMMIR